MAMKITDTEMTSDQTRHTAARGDHDEWIVSWLPGRLLTRDQAVTAMTIAESVNAALDPSTQERVWPHIEWWAAELGLSDVDAVAMASLAPEFYEESSPVDDHADAIMRLEQRVSELESGVRLALEKLSVIK